MRIILTSIMDHPSNESIDVPNHHLPPECESSTSHRCDILRFEHNGVVYHVIPSVRKLVVITYNITTTTDNINDTRLHISFVSITENCNPTNSFYAGRDGGYRIFVACLDLQSRPSGSLRYLEYYIAQNGGSILRNTDAVTRTETIYDPETVSEVVFVRNQRRCSYIDNLYFIDTLFVLHYPADYRAFDPEFLESNRRVENCDKVESIENYGDDNLLIRCSNGQVALYDTCSSVFSYVSEDRVPYPCASWDTVIYRNNSQLRLQRRGTSSEFQQKIDFPHSDLVYGTCVEGDTPTFVGIDDSGATFIASMGGGDNSNVTRISEGFDIRSENSSTEWIYRPVFSDDRQIFGVYDANTSEFLIVNLTAKCEMHPIILRINVSTIDLFPLDSLVAISAGEGSYNCNCQNTYDIIEPAFTLYQYHDIPDAKTAPSTSYATPISTTTPTFEARINAGKINKQSDLVWWHIVVPVIVASFLLFAIGGVILVNVGV